MNFQTANSIIIEYDEVVMESRIEIDNNIINERTRIDKASINTLLPPITRMLPSSLEDVSFFTTDTSRCYLEHRYEDWQMSIVGKQASLAS